MSARISISDEDAALINKWFKMGFSSRAISSSYKKRTNKTISHTTILALLSEMKAEEVDLTAVGDPPTPPEVVVRARSDHEQFSHALEAMGTLRQRALAQRKGSPEPTRIAFNIVNAELRMLRFKIMLDGGLLKAPRRGPEVVVETGPAPAESCVAPTPPTDIEPPLEKLSAAGDSVTESAENAGDHNLSDDSSNTFTAPFQSPATGPSGAPLPTEAAPRPDEGGPPDVAEHSRLPLSPWLSGGAATGHRSGHRRSAMIPPPLC